MNSTTAMLALLHRTDSWTNFFTGLGNPLRDKTSQGFFDHTNRLSDPELSDMYAGDGIARKIVNVGPREMFRGGFQVTAGDDKGAANEIQAHARTLDVRSVFRDTMIWSSLYGGGVVFVGADDNKSPDEPLDPKQVRSLTFLQSYDRRRAVPSQWYRDAEHPKYGRPAVYMLTAVDGRISWVHESRLVIFRGAHTDPITSRILNYWDFSVLQAPYETIRGFWMSHKSGEYMLQDASQAVIKVRNLFGQIAAGDLKNLITRAQFTDMTRSVARALLLDADGGESFEKVQTSFAGVPDMLDRFCNLLSAVTEIPVTVLMGQSPAGLQATGVGDTAMRVWYDHLAGQREEILTPRLEQVISLIARAMKYNGPTGVEFPSFWQENPKEKAERQKIEAEGDHIRIQDSVLDPDEVAMARFGGGKPGDIVIAPGSRAEPPTIPAAQIPGALPGPPNQPNGNNPGGD